MFVKTTLNHLNNQLIFKMILKLVNVNNRSNVVAFVSFESKIHVTDRRHANKL